MPESAVKRVLMTGDTVGGVWTFTLELAQGLGEHGIEVMLASMGGLPSSEQRAEAAAIPNLQLLTSEYKLEWMDDPWGDVHQSGRWLLELEREFAPQVVHLNSYGHGGLSWRAPVLLTAHSCVLSWWSAVRNEAAPPEWDRYRYEVECSVRTADLWTAPSSAMLRAIEAHYGPALPACRMVPNGRSESRYHASAKQPFVLAAGRLWDEAKNVAAVARAAERLPWPVYVAGENCHPNGAAVWFPGARMLGRLPPDALAGWYGRASIYALPARYEPFGLSALEAALSGCALVLGDLESLREVWGDAAVFVPPLDKRRLEAALGDLMADPAELTEMARRSTERARMFTAARMARGYADAYDWVAGIRRMACAS